MDETNKRGDVAFLLFALAFHARLRARSAVPEPALAPSQREALAAAAAQDAQAALSAFTAAFGEDALP